MGAADAGNTERPMRITNNMIADQVLSAITDSRSRLNTIQEQLATSKRINRPSDDPLGSTLTLQFTSATKSLNAFQRAIDAGQAFLRATADPLDHIAEVLVRAKEIGLQGSSDTTQGTRGAMATEVNQLLEDLLSQGNGRFADRYLFGGTQTAAPPFSATRDASGQITAVTVNPLGTDATVQAAVADGVRVQTNVPGSTVFSKTVDLFTGLINLRDALAAEDTAAVVTATTTVDQGVTQVTDASGTVGAAIQRLDAIRTLNQKDLTRFESLRSGVQDADIAELYVELQTREQALQASLAAGARAMQPSLLDFLS
jgi:flagellar hook-associated protein 3 FlgL